MAWRRFVLTLLAAILGGSLALAALVALIDPWGTLPFRSPFPRLPADHSQRWAFPELARDRRFDGVIIGNSATRLFDPADLDPAAGARFANLAMVGAFPYEQSRLLDVFLAAHPAPRAVMVGLDRVWCERGDDQPRFGYDPIPEWLYDGDRLAALANLLNLHAIETAWRALAAGLGLSPRPYGDNGYRLLDVDFHPYDPRRADALLEEHLGHVWPSPPTPDPATWQYRALDDLAPRLDRLPPGTRVLLVFVPRYHLYPAPDSPGRAMIDECKRRAVAIARRRPNTEVYDMAIPGPLTTTKDKWWDAVHARPEPMAEASRTLAQAFGGHAGPDVAILSGQNASVSAR